MHTHSIDEWRHEHHFLGAQHGERERRTWIVVGLTAVMMVVEIAGGAVFGSMALVADGWHMATHAAALAVAALAYGFARRHASDPRFSFGAGKVGELAGFASAVALAMVAALIAYECLARLWSPVAIDYAEALLIAALGLAVNLASAWILGDGHDHDHEHGHGDGEAHDRSHAYDHGRDHPHAHAGDRAHDRAPDPHDHHDHRHDHNHRAAYLHVLADALTSALAIAGLLAARAFDWPWIDPAVGLAGSVMIARWAWGLMRSSGAVLLDASPSPRTVALVRERLERDGDQLADLHLWRVGPGHLALAAVVVSDRPQPPAVYKARLGGLDGISHATIEVNQCPGHGGGMAC